jgi:hypothetical protein
MLRGGALLLLLGLPSSNAWQPVATYSQPYTHISRTSKARMASPLVRLSRRNLLLGAGVLPLATQKRVAATVDAPVRPLIASAGVDPLCDPCVTVVRSATGQQITLIGTAHISDDSALLVRDVVRAVAPDTVMIELDPSRAAKLIGSAPASLRIARPIAADPGEVAATATATTAMPSPPIDAPQVAAATTPRFGLGQVAGRVLRGDFREAGAEAIGAGLSSMYRQLDQLGFQSGQEFVVAVAEADRIGATLLLGDRDARETIRRLRDAVGELLAHPPADSGAVPPPAMLAQAGGASEFNRENVLSTMAVLKQRDNVRELTAYLKAEVPALYEALIAERDAHMANVLLNSDGRRLVAVVGLAHVDGIAANIVRRAGARELSRPAACTIA